MIMYLTGNTFQQVLHNTIVEQGEIIVGTEIANEIDFLKFAKQSIAALETLDILIIDISACINTDEEIIKALEMIRTMYDDLRIIVFAAYRTTGDDLLTRCFNLGIHNIINTDDFVEIRNEVKKCITVGKSFKDAVKYKDYDPEKVIVKHEIKKTVNGKKIGMMGTGINIGVTHNAIVLANCLRKKGYMVALAEMNPSGVFKQIMEEYEENEFEGRYFTLLGIDYYWDCNRDKLEEISEHPYNFIILDLGMYQECDEIALEKCDEKIVITGSKPWEYQDVTGIFKLYEKKKRALQKMVFCFNMTPQREHKEIRQGMGVLKENVHFLSYTEDPFSSDEFSDADIIFAEYLPDKEQEQKKKKSKFHVLVRGKKNEKGKN